MSVGLSHLGPGDFLFLASWVLLTSLIRWRFRHQRAEMRPSIRRVGEFITLVLLAAPALVVIGALSGHLETKP
jgi:hypothetical protein